MFYAATLFYHIFSPFDLYNFVCLAFGTLVRHGLLDRTFSLFLLLLLLLLLLSWRTEGTALFKGENEVHRCYFFFSLRLLVLFSLLVIAKGHSLFAGAAATSGWLFASTYPSRQPGRLIGHLKPA
jgi:hypothetical protein